MRRFNWVVTTGLALALMIGIDRIAVAQLTGSGPQVGVPNISVPKTGGGGGSSDSNRRGGASDEVAKKKASEDARIALAKARAELAAKEAERKAVEAKAKLEATEKARLEQVKKAAENKAKADQLKKAEEARLAQEKVRADAAEKVRLEKLVATAPDAKMTVAAPSIRLPAVGSRTTPETRPTYTDTRATTVVATSQKPVATITATTGAKTTVAAPTVTLTARTPGATVYTAPPITAKTAEVPLYVTGTKPKPTPPTPEEQLAVRERLSKQLVEQFSEVTEAKPRKEKPTADNKTAETSTAKPDRPKATDKSAEPVITTGLLDCSNPKFKTDNPDFCRTKKPEKPTDTFTGKILDTEIKAERSKPAAINAVTSTITPATTDTKNPAATRADIGEQMAKRNRGTCIGGKAPVPSISSIFDVAKAKSVNIPFKPEQIGKLLLLENPDNPLQQFIILPIIDTSDDTVHEVLVTDPKTALFRILNLGKGKELHVVKDANGTGTILVMVATDGIKYLPNASTLVATKMKDAASIDKLSALPKAELADAAVTWNSVLIPTGEKVLTAEPNNTGIVAVTATEAGVIKGIRLFASVSDATGKFIPILEATKYTLRKMIVTPDIGKLATDLAFTIKDKNSASFLVMHSADILTENPIFTMLTDKAAVSEELEKADSKSKVKNSEKVSGKKKDKTKKNDKDEEDDKLNDTFKELLAEALVAGKVGQPVVSHAFEDYGDKLATLVIQDGGLGLVKIDNGTIVSKKDEQLSLGTEGSACGSFIDALPVDLDNAGGKDVALFINNGDMVSMVVYPNINQVQKFESVTAEANGGTIQLHQKSVTEENESLNCKWEAYKKENDGTLTDVTSQLDNPNSCDPIFKPGAPASKTSLLEKPSILGTVAQWLVAQMSISTAYAEEATTPTDYVFRVTTTDPDGLQATAQVTTQISATKAVQGTALTSDQGLTNQGLTNITSDSLEIKIVEVKMPTPAPIDEAKTSGTTTSPVTPLNVGETTGIGAQALAPQPSAPPIPTAGGDVMESGGGMHAFATEGGCSLTRNTVPLTSMGWLWVLPLLAFIPTRAICYQRSPRRPSRCRWGHGRRH